MLISKVPINDIIPYPDNPKHHTYRNLQVIYNSLIRHNQYRPLIVQKSTNYILKGNGTYQSLKKAGYTHVDCVFIDIKDTDAVSLVIADNRIAELSEWDNERLKCDLEQIGNGELWEEMGFSKSFITELFDTNIDNKNKNTETLLKKEKKKVYCPMCGKLCTSQDKTDES